MTHTPLLEELQAEHAEILVMLADLQETLLRPAGRGRDEQLGVRLRDLAELLRIHARKEEAIVFPLAEQAIGPEHAAPRAGSRSASRTAGRRSLRPTKGRRS